MTTLSPSDNSGGNTAKKLRTVAALFVQTDGCYFGLDGIDPWDEARDARLYNGPHPVVAHPPCQRWGKMWAGSPLVIARTGVRKKKGDDGGCFKAALSAVRKFGGIIEHPWGSHAWAHFGIEKPSRQGGWIKADNYGGWTCCVEQGRYGHYARKPTLLLAYGCDLPELDWGEGEPRIGTPKAFRNILIKMARSVRAKPFPALPSCVRGQGASIGPSEDAPASFNRSFHEAINA